MKKISKIRSDKSKDLKCPFGLPIILACKFAGCSVNNMYPINDISLSKNEYNNIKKMNYRIYIYKNNNDKCIYASNIIEKYNSVNCNFDDTASGMDVPFFSASPLYPSFFNNELINNLYSSPLGYYSDYESDRNLFLGLFSLVGSNIYDLLKQSDCDFKLKKILNKFSKYLYISDNEKKYIINKVPSWK